MNDSSTTLKPPYADAASDEELASRVQAGCKSSFNELAMRMQPRLLYVLRRRMLSYTDAEDVVQKTLLRAYEKIHLFDLDRKFSPWLFTIALRLATDHHRLKRIPTDPTGESTATVVDPAPSPEQQAIDAEESDDLWTVAERVLKADQWTALWLLFGEGQSAKEIAQAMGRSSVSVRVMLYRAKKALAPHLLKFAGAVGAKTEQIATKPVPQVARAE